MLMESVGQELGQGMVGLVELYSMMFRDSIGKTHTAGARFF